MTSDQTNAGISMPSWIESSLFENIAKEKLKDFQCIRNFVVKPGSAAGENYATLMLKIDMDVEMKDGSSQPLSFMIKTCHDNDVMREMMKSHNIFDIEKSMYVDIVPAFEKLYADAGIEITFGAKSYDIETKENYILLENLTPKGFKNVNRLEGLDMEHTKCVLHKLAMWHAASAVYCQKIGGYEDKYLHGFLREETKGMMQEMHKKFAPIARKCLTKLSNYEEYGEELENCFDGMIDAMYNAAKVDETEFNVLNHGDFWANNIMFQYNDEGKIKETYLIDYQVPKYGTPAQDLYYLLMSSIQFEIKLKKFDYFIKYYHDHLSKYLKVLKYEKKIPSLIDIHKMLFKYGILGLSAATGVMAVVLLDPTDCASMETWMSESDAGEAFRMLMYSNARYKKHLEVILPWMQNRGALSF